MSDYNTRERAAHEQRLPHVAAIAAALGGSVCSLLEEHRDPERRAYYVPRWYSIHLPGELFALQLCSGWHTGEAKFRASLVIPGDPFQPTTSPRLRIDWPHISWNRPAAAAAADIRRRAINAHRAAVAETIAQRRRQQQEGTARALFREHVAQLLGVDALQHSGSTYHESYIAPGFTILRHDLDAAADGAAAITATVRIPTLALPAFCQFVRGLQQVPGGAPTPPGDS